VETALAFVFELAWQSSSWGWENKYRPGRTSVNQGLLHRAAGADVPMTTRTVLLYLTLTRVSGSFNDGYADNISLVLTARATLFLPALRR